MPEPGSRRLCWDEAGRTWATKWAFRSADRIRTLVWSAKKYGHNGWWETWKHDHPLYSGSW